MSNYDECCPVQQAAELQVKVFDALAALLQAVQELVDFSNHLADKVMEARNARPN